MTFDQMKMSCGAAWVLTASGVAVAAGVSGATPVLIVTALALIPPTLTFLLWQEPARTVAEVIHDTDIGP